MAVDGVSVPRRYIPTHLTMKDKKLQIKELRKSRRAYKKGKYYTRKKLKSFKSKLSPHIQKAKKMYGLSKLRLNKHLARKTKCKLAGLKKIFRKGQGAYFSSGSRPSQTPHSWAYARLASSITGGKASGVDRSLLEKYCSKNSKALRNAKNTKYGTRKVKQVKMGGANITFKGGARGLKEKIIGFKKGQFPKKYTAHIKHGKKTRKIHFGDQRYQQYKDRTPLGLYSFLNHGDIRRMRNYFSRHSGSKKRGEAIKKEIEKSRGLYNAKILSHIYLW